MKKAMITAACILFSLGGICTALADQDAQQQQAGDPVAATVNGQPVTVRELDAHMAATKLPREEALDDLIDLRLLRAALAANNISAPAGTWSPDERADLELALTRALGFYVPPLHITLIVDHAWLKDAENEAERTAGRALLERLRALVAAGATIPDAYTQLQVDGSLWHIGDHEEYLTLVLPPEVQNLPAGSLSPIVPGDGGLHLFRIYERKQERLPVDEIRVPLLTRLRLDATIDRPDTPNQ